MKRPTRRAALGLLGAGLLRPGAVRAQTRTVVDSAGRHVTLPERISRVLVAGPPASVLVYALAPEMMLGWVRAPSPAQKQFLAAPMRDLPETGRLTGRGDTMSLERLVAARPDLVLDFGSVTGTYVSLADRVQGQTGIPYVLIDGRFAATQPALQLAAGILDRVSRGRALASYAQATFDSVDKVLERVPRQRRPRVYLARGPEGLETGGRGSINTEIIERAGGINVAESPAGRGNIFNASLEQIISWDPDTIVTMDRSFFAGVSAKPGWDRIRAVARKRVHLAPGLPWGWIDAPPSLNRLIGLRWLSTIFYPAEANLDLRSETRAFYDLFYGVKLDEAGIDRVLDGAETR